MTPDSSRLHADAMRVLSEWAAPDAGQAALRQDYLDHLAARADAMDRECVSGHLTASALIVDPDGRVLLTLHRRLGRWLQTGGHCEAQDGGLALAALREATEESGIPDLEISASPVRLDRHLVPCAGPGSQVPHLDVQYVARAGAGAVHVISEESLDLAWFEPSSLPESTDASVRALVAAAR